MGSTKIAKQLHKLQLAVAAEKCRYCLSINNITYRKEPTMNYNNYLKDEDDEETVDVEVYNIVPDDIRSRLGILDLEDEDDLQGDHTE